MSRKKHTSTETQQAVSPVDVITPGSGVPAGIEYVGLRGISRECQDGVLRLLQYGDKISHARILSSSNDHCLLLTINGSDIVAVKSGFASGYGGEGPRTFSYVLQVLDGYGVEIEEYVVSAEVIERLDESSLTRADIEAIDAAEAVRPSRWYDYIFEDDFKRGKNGTLWQKFPLVIPFAVIDGRLADLALSFWEDPDNRLLTGYRRLEDIVRNRTAVDEHGAKLFSQAFAPKGGRLTWKDVSEGERAGRMTLFTGTYTAYRNPRAHRESKHKGEKLLEEFLLLNHLYRLEKEASEVS
jgi:hypothetical protein